MNKTEVEKIINDYLSNNKNDNDKIEIIIDNYLTTPKNCNEESFLNSLYNVTMLIKNLVEKKEMKRINGEKYFKVDYILFLNDLKEAVDSLYFKK